VDWLREQSINQSTNQSVSQSNKQSILTWPKQHGAATMTTKWNGGEEQKRRFVFGLNIFDHETVAMPIKNIFIGRALLVSCSI